MVHNTHSIGFAGLLGLAALFLVSCGSGDTGGSTPTAAIGNAVMAQSAINGNGASGFNYAIFGKNGVTMSGGSYTDSYSSNPAAIRPWTSRGVYTNGDVSTNWSGACKSNTYGINMSGGLTEIYGKALVGPGGNPATGICASGGALVQNNNTGVLSVAMDVTPPAAPSPAAGTAMGNFNLPAGATRSLPAEDYNST